MHPYVSDSDEVVRVPLWLAFLSLLAAWLLHAIILLMNFTPPYILDIPSFAGWYIIFYKLFDKVLWQWPFCRRIGLVKVPNLSGFWDGHIVSSFDDHSSEIK